MTCGINLGFLLLLHLPAACVCSSWVSNKGKSSLSQNADPPGDLWYVQGSDGSSKPQDGFRQAYVVQASSSNQRLFSSKKSTSESGPDPPVPPYSSSRVNPQRQKVVSSGGIVPQAAGQGSIVAGSSFAGDPSKQVRTLPRQQSTQHGPKENFNKLSPWKPQSSGPGAVAQLSGAKGKGSFNPPNEHVKSTSGLSRGTKVSIDGSDSSISPFINPVASDIHKRYEVPISQRFGLPQSQNPRLVPLQTGFGQENPDFVVHHIPWRYGGYPIKRLGEGDEDEEPPEQTTTTKKPARVYTFPPRPVESYRTQKPKVHHKSMWLRVRSNQLTGLPRVL